MKRYAPPKPAPLPEDYDEFYATLTPAERELDALAKEMLASSYFIQWSHMYLKWSKAKAQAMADSKAKAQAMADSKAKAQAMADSKAKE
jgi:hypothetical protein